MPFRPRLLVAAAAAQSLLLALLAHEGEPPRIELAEAGLHEGHRVQVAGIVAAVRGDHASSRLTLRAGPHTLEVAVEAPLHPPRGSWAEAAGRLLRSGGTLTLRVEDPSRLQFTPPPGAAAPSWPDLARDPAAWAGQPLRLQGTVERGTLRDGDGLRVALGDGPWPTAGAVEATGALLYDGSCLCHTLSASSVRPLGPAWNP